MIVICPIEKKLNNLSRLLRTNKRDKELFV